MSRRSTLWGSDRKADRLRYLLDHPPQKLKIESPASAGLNEWTIQTYLFNELNRMGARTVGNVRADLDLCHHMYCDLVVYDPGNRPRFTVEVKPEPVTKWKGVPDTVLDQMWVYSLLPVTTFLVRGMASAQKFVGWLGVRGWPRTYQEYLEFVEHYDPKLRVCLPVRVPVPPHANGHPLADRSSRINWWKDPTSEVSRGV